MTNKIIFIVAMLLSISCTNVHRSAIQIYESGEIGDMKEWIEINKTIVRDRDTLRYKYDTNLFVQRAYFEGKSQRKLQGFAFYYKNKPTGKAFIFHENGNIRAENYFKDGVLDGDCKIYDENKNLETILHFSNGKVTNITHTGAYKN